MNRAIAIVVVLAAAGGCKRKGGGGGAWLVGEDALMANIAADGSLGPGYDLDTEEDLFGIGCRGDEAAFVVGGGGTFLRTYDAATWDAVDAGTAVALTDVAVAWDLLYVASDDGLRVTYDDGDTWEVIAGQGSAWQTVSTTDTGEVALALDDAASLWRWDGTTLAPAGALAGARAAAISHDGEYAAVAGDAGALAWSDDGGVGWDRVETGVDAALRSVWVSGRGEVIAVGDGGTVVRFADGEVTTTTLGDATFHAVRLGGAEGFAASADGAVYATYDTGATWDRLEVAIPGVVLDLDDIE